MSQNAMVMSMVAVASVSEGIAPGLKSAWARAADDPAGEAALAREVEEYPLSNAELLASLERFKPPQSWYDEDHEGLY
jgi:hypothetical protein